MSKYSNLVLAFLILYSNSSCSQKVVQHEGLVNFYTNLNSREFKDHKIWFKDSSIIYEMKVFNTTSYDSDTGRVNKSSYDVYKYTYLDLRNKKCQDYRFFSDTATMICNYYLTPKQGIGVFDFYSDISKRDITEGLPLKPMSDTMIDGRKFSRQSAIDTTGFITVFYFDCDIPNSIFSLNRRLDKKFSGCKVVRIELINTKQLFPNTTRGFTINQKRLTPAESKIFDRWTKNASETNLPVLTLEDVYKIPISVSADNK